MKRVFYTFLLGAVGACNQIIGDDIPCRDDDTCPTNYYCSHVGQCAELSDTSSPPDVQVLGVALGKDDAPQPSITLDAKGRLQTFYIAFHNAGGSEAAYPEVTLKSDDCLDIEGGLASNLIGIMRPGDTTSQSVYVDPEQDGSCVGTKHVSVSIAVSQTSTRPPRTSTGAFDVVLE